jgi:hypothetical protein
MQSTVLAAAPPLSFPAHMLPPFVAKRESKFVPETRKSPQLPAGCLGPAEPIRFPFGNLLSFQAVLLP